ncbi:DegV family protein [Metamycoplasma equirhinis]|uniref:DegV family protein n=1 Tax=Metamycoplasma equirhinis TaxID=92402 RepID=UPI003593B499
MKIKIIVDSSSGLLKNEAEALGWELMPLQSEIDGKTYQNGINMDIDKFEEIWRANRKVDALTFATPPGVAEEIVNKYINDYDKIIIYGISAELSSQVNNLKQLFADNNKVFVVDSKKLSYSLLRDALLFEDAINEDTPFEEAVKIFDIPHERLLLVPKYNDALVKGGRLSKSAATIAKLLKIVPIIKMENGKLEKDSIGRIFSKTLDKLTKELFDKIDKNDLDQHLLIIHANSFELDEIVERIKKITNNWPNIISMKLSTDIAVHTGIDAVCLTATKIKKSIQEKFYTLVKKH